MIEWTIYAHLMQYCRHHIYQSWPQGRLHNSDYINFALSASRSRVASRITLAGCLLVVQQTQQGFQHSLWHGTSSICVGSVCPKGEHSADVAIIGGGITGVATALELTKSGVDVVILEADCIGFGASGRNAGFVVPNLSKVDPDGMVASLGEQGELLARTVGAAGQAVYSAIREERIDCDARQAGWFQPAASDDELRVIEQRQKQWRKYGLSVELMDREETTSRTGCQDYLGSLYVPTGGTLHPLKFTCGLALRAEANGCRIWTSSRVRECSYYRNGWRLNTGDSIIVAKQVLVCTNALSGGLLPYMERAVVPVRIFQFATVPLPECERRHLFQNGECLSDMRVNLFTYRFDTNWRLITGQIPVSRFGLKRVLLPLIARRLKKHLSLSSTYPIEFVWDGLATITQDFLPQIFELDKQLLAVTGCNGRGIGMSYQLGKAIGRYVVSNDLRELPVPIVRPRKFRMRWVTSIASRLYPIYGLMTDP